MLSSVLAFADLNVIHPFYLGTVPTGLDSVE